MKKIALITMLVSATLSHAMDSSINPFIDLSQQLKVPIINEPIANGLTPLQTLCTMPIPEIFDHSSWITADILLERCLTYKADPNLINPQTGSTALGDLIKNCHPTNDHIYEMTKRLIQADARLHNIDNNGNSFCDLLVKARTSGVLSQDRYDQIETIPEVQQHIVQMREARAHNVSEILGLFLPPALHPTVTQYECNFPQ